MLSFRLFLVLALLPTALLAEERVSVSFHNVGFVSATGEEKRVNLAVSGIPSIQDGKLRIESIEVNHDLPRGLRTTSQAKAAFKLILLDALSFQLALQIRDLSRSEDGTPKDTSSPLILASEVPIAKVPLQIEGKTKRRYLTGLTFQEHQDQTVSAVGHFATAFASKSERFNLSQVAAKFTSLNPWLVGNDWFTKEKPGIEPLDLGDLEESQEFLGQVFAGASRRPTSAITHSLMSARAEKLLLGCSLVVKTPEVLAEEKARANEAEVSGCLGCGVMGCAGVVLAGGGTIVGLYGVYSFLSWLF